MKSKLEKYSFNKFLFYFFKLGLTGFGGPVVLVNRMQADLVEKNKWIKNEEFLEGLAFSKLCPGPLATQLAIYLGWVKRGTLGATLTGLSLILPSFLMVVSLAYLYKSLGKANFPWIESLFYGVNAAIIGIVINSVVNLSKNTFQKNTLLWIVFLVNASVTMYFEAESIWMLFLSGSVSLIISSPKLIQKLKSHFLITLALYSPTSLQTPVPAFSAPFSKLFLLLTYFAKVSIVVFGSGLAIVPFLHQGVVNQYHWLTDREFLDSIAVGMITPGPMVITSAFIGYLVGDLPGSIAASLGIFLPVYLFVVVLAPYYRLLAKNPYIKSFVAGLTAAAIGGIAGGAYILGRKALVDPASIALALLSFLVLISTRKMLEPLIILSAGLIGILIH